MKEKSARSSLEAFQLKGSLLTLTVLELLKTDMPAISAQLLSLAQLTPDLFRRMPIIIDLHKLTPETDAKSFSFDTLKKLLTKQGLVPVGVRGGNAEWQQSAADAGLALLNNVRSINKPENIKKPEKTDIKNPKLQTKLITQPVRSGQQIYAKDSDLIILTSVSPGAEILSDGNIHVYGTLRGRALAGVNGDKTARIFCQTLKAELVSIAGHYWVSEDLLALAHNQDKQENPANQTIQVYLENDHLQIGLI